VPRIDRDLLRRIADVRDPNLVIVRAAEKQGRCTGKNEEAFHCDTSCVTVTGISLTSAPTVSVSVAAPGAIGVLRTSPFVSSIPVIGSVSVDVAGSTARMLGSELFHSYCRAPARYTSSPFTSEMGV